MTKLYEAMQSTQLRVNPTVVEANANPVLKAAQPSRIHRLSLLGLYHALQIRLDQYPRKLVGFVSARPGEGTSTIVRELALTLVNRIGRSVLVIDTDPRQPQISTLHGTSGLGLDEILDRPAALDAEIRMVGAAGLCVLPVSRRAALTAHTYETLLSPRSVDMLRDRFDYVLYDSPALSTGSQDVAMLGRLDGVVMVVEAEQTRQPVFLNGRRLLDAMGANIVGSVLNKRRFYIPQKIYRML